MGTSMRQKREEHAPASGTASGCTHAGPKFFFESVSFALVFFWGAPVAGKWFGSLSEPLTRISFAPWQSHPPVDALTNQRRPASLEDAGQPQPRLKGSGRPLRRLSEPLTLDVRWVRPDLGAQQLRW